MTVNALQPSVKLLRQQRYTQNDLMVDPLIVLRNDPRVFRYFLLRNVLIYANCDAANIICNEKKKFFDKYSIKFEVGKIFERI